MRTDQQPQHPPQGILCFALERGRRQRVGGVSRRSGGQRDAWVDGHGRRRRNSQRLVERRVKLPRRLAARRGCRGPTAGARVRTQRRSWQREFTCRPSLGCAKGGLQPCKRVLLFLLLLVAATYGFLTGALPITR